jgi:hypothetical protein
MTDNDQIRLSHAIALLCAAGVGEIDVLQLIANAGLGGRLIATGYRSTCEEGRHLAGTARQRVDRHMWRVLASTKPAAEAYQRWAYADEIGWTLGDGDKYQHRVFDGVTVDRAFFDLWLRDVVDRYQPGKVSREEIEEWIRAYPGSNSKTAWADFQRHFGPGACKRDVDFRPAWLEVRGNPQRGQPRKKSPAPSPL